MTKPIKPLEQQIDEYKSDERFTKILKGNNWIDNKWSSYEYTTWNWDEYWDGKLIKDVIALEQVGFIIVEFSRKRKVTLKAPDIKDYPISKNAHIVNLIDKAVSGYYSIMFKPTLSIYWKGRTSRWNF